MNDEKVMELLISMLSDKKQDVKCNSEKYPFCVGKTYFIRTVTYHLIAEVESFKSGFIVFKKGTISWVADSGRFKQAIDDGVLNEVEPICSSGGVNISSITDYFEWNHYLPKTQK